MSEKCCQNDHGSGDLYYNTVICSMSRDKLQSIIDQISALDKSDTHKPGGDGRAKWSTQVAQILSAHGVQRKFIPWWDWENWVEFYIEELNEI